jgi:hypothetical protein
MIKKRPVQILNTLLIITVLSIVSITSVIADSDRDDAPYLYFEKVYSNWDGEWDEPGDIILVTHWIYIKNNGTADAINETVTLTADGRTFSNHSVNVPVGDQIFVQFKMNFTALEDDQTFHRTIELPNFPNETYEDDFLIPGDKDIADFSLDMDFEYEAEAGHPLEIEVTIKNTGDAFADFVDVTLDVDGTKIGEINFFNITISGTNTSVYEWPIPLTFAPGNYLLNASIEGAEIMTSGDLNITEFRKPLLKVEFDKNHKGKVQNYYVAIQEGERAIIDVQLVLRNKGTANATNVTITITDRKGKRLGNTTINDFPPGYQEMVTVRIKVKNSGDFKIHGQVDYQQEGGHCYRTQTKESAKVVVERGSGPLCPTFIIPLVVLPSIIFTRRLKKVRRAVSVDMAYLALS